MKDITTTTIIKVNRELETLTPNPTIEEAQKIVGGWVEVCPNNGTSPFILMDEEGRLKSKPINHKASSLMGFEVVGDAIIMFGKFS